jgi:phosphate transport system substrate-binding protein
MRRMSFEFIVVRESTGILANGLLKDFNHQGATMPFRSLHRSLTLLLSLTLGGLGACNSSKSVQLSGAGSSFVYPLMTRWIANYHEANQDIRINYQSIGSGGGIEQVKKGTVDFGASDAALSDEKLKGMPPVLQIPESAGPICITYNIPGLQQPLRLSGEVLAGIYLGKITNWQDPAIAQDNPGVSLPKQQIAVAHRADGSGTTAIFTTYLAAVSPDWAKQVGAGTAVNWPLGLGGKGSEGVTGQVRQSPGAIGYVELTYAQQNKLPVAQIKNKAGNYVEGTAAGTTQAIEAFSAQLAKDPRIPIVDPPATAATAYPISGLTFLIVPKDGDNPAKRAALKKFILYMISDGQTVANSMGYAPLPDGVRQYNQQTLGQMQASGQTLP